ncbi:MAG: hypothetical protein KC996_02635 [Phycisphaerales bacterium]|nr:hypothetical protein [Phycisphaerales bacterium]
MITPPPDQPVVHIVAPPSSSSEGTAFGRLLPVVLCANAIRLSAVPDGQILIIGDTSAERTATTLGLPRTRRITPILRNQRFCARLLRSIVPNTAHLICWSDELSSVLAETGTSSELISTAPNLAPRPPQSRTMIRVLDEIDRDTWSDLGRDATLDRDLPALVDSFSAPAHRDTLRDQLAIEPQTILLAPLTDDPSQTDAREFAFLLGLLAAAGYRIAGLLPDSARNIHTARRHHRALHKPFRLFTTPSPILQSLPAIDLMLSINHTPSASVHLLERLCENTGVPVMRLTHAGRKGLAGSPGESIQLIQQFDQLTRERTAVAANIQ